MTRIRAICHVHSEWSYDAEWSLERLASLFSKFGARVVLMTEHDRGFTQERFEAYRSACVAASGSRITIIPGIEYSDPENTVHILTWGLSRFLGENLAPLDVLGAVREMGGASVLAHPARKNAWQQVTPEWIALLDGIELWNRKTDGARPGVEAKRLINAHAMPAFAGMDFHRRKHLFPLWMRLTLAGPMPKGHDDIERAVVEAIQGRRASGRAFGLPVTAWTRWPARPLAAGLEMFRKIVAGTGSKPSE